MENKNHSERHGGFYIQTTSSDFKTLFPILIRPELDTENFRSINAPLNNPNNIKLHEWSEVLCFIKQKIDDGSIKYDSSSKKWA